MWKKISIQVAICEKKTGQCPVFSRIKPNRILQASPQIEAEAHALHNKGNV